MNCKHKNRTPIGLNVSNGIEIANASIDANIVIRREVYYCEDCRVLFVPQKGEITSEKL